MSKQCPHCRMKRVGPVKVWHLHTNFTRDEDNQFYGCVHCVEEVDLHFAYDWAEYYSSQGHYTHHAEFLPVRRPWKTQPKQKARWWE